MLIFFATQLVMMQEAHISNESLSSRSASRQGIIETTATNDRYVNYNRGIFILN